MGTRANHVRLHDEAVFLITRVCSSVPPSEGKTFKAGSSGLLGRLLVVVVRFVVLPSVGPTSSRRLYGAPLWCFFVTTRTSGILRTADRREVQGGYTPHHRVVRRDHSARERRPQPRSSHTGTAQGDQHIRGGVQARGPCARTTFVWKHLQCAQRHRRALQQLRNENEPAEKTHGPGVD